MDSAELQQRLTQQEERMEEICHLLRQPIPTPPMPGIVTHSTPSFISMPGKYDGSPGKRQGFLMQCCKYIEPLTRPGWILLCLYSQAKPWIGPLPYGLPTAQNSDPRPISTPSSKRYHSPSGRPIGDLLIELQQGRNSAAEYALEFLNMAARSGWSEAAYRLPKRDQQGTSVGAGL